jgi:hypothetical protein
MPVDNSGLTEFLIQLLKDQQQQHDLKQDLREQRQELREQRQELKQDLKEVKHEIKELRLAGQQDLKELRLAGQQDLKELKQGLASKQELRWYAITLLLIAAAAGVKELLPFVKVL